MRHAGWILLCALVALLWLSIASPLWLSWRGDSSLSHGPLVPLITAALLWARRSELQQWTSARPAGLVLLTISVLLFVASMWADIVFLKPLSLIGVMMGGIWFLGDWRALRASIGALGFLLFMIPWPTTLIASISFPLQLTSSKYAALLGGICGLPIEREGVQLFVVPNLNAKPIYSIVVAQACSGLTSLMVLLALGYLVAYHTEIGLGWRALMVALVVPLTLLTNSVRLTFILLAGAHSNGAVAQWVHDHEGPVLIFFCSIALTALRSALLIWTRPRTDSPEDAHMDGEPQGELQ